MLAVLGAVEHLRWLLWAAVGVSWRNSRNSPGGVVLLSTRGERKEWLHLVAHARADDVVELRVIGIRRAGHVFEREVLQHRKPLERRARHLRPKMIALK
jgi:hypothetical protein